MAARALLVLAALGAVLSGCREPSAETRAPTRPVVVTSVAPIADIARAVAGDRAEVVQLVPDGTDSHTFEPTPASARVLGRADVVFLNGLDLEEPTLRLARENVRDGVQVVLLGDRSIGPEQYVYDAAFSREAGHPNPHLWMSPAYAQRYAEIVRDAMAALDPAGAGEYRGRQRRFAARLRDLDRAIRRAVGTIPRDHRRLVTYHDSFAYFAPRYGMEVVAAVQPADFSEPTPREVVRIVEQVRAAGVPAVFGSEVFDSRVLERVSAEAGARYVDELADDALPGDPGDPQHTYVGMMVRNVRIMTRALGGDASALDAVPVANPA